MQNKKKAAQFYQSDITFIYNYFCDSLFKRYITNYIDKYLSA